MSIINPFEIEIRLHAIIGEFESAWERVANHRGDYTPEGIVKAFSTAAAPATAKLNSARLQLEDYAAGIEKILPAERARILPAAPAGGFTVAQELAAARILGRTTEWDAIRMRDVLAPLAGTPAATLLLEEFEARGYATAGVEQQLLFDSSERYAAVAKLHPLLLTGLNGPLMSLLREAERAANAETWLRNHRAPGTHTVSLSDAHGPVRLDTFNGTITADNLPALN